MSAIVPDDFDGYAEAKRRAARLRSDPEHARWVREVRAQLATGSYRSTSERRLAERPGEDAVDS